jgi:hypothetical protein
MAPARPAVSGSDLVKQNKLVLRISQSRPVESPSHTSPGCPSWWQGLEPCRFRLRSQVQAPIGVSLPTHPLARTIMNSGVALASTHPQLSPLLQVQNELPRSFIHAFPTLHFCIGLLICPRFFFAVVGFFGSCPLWLWLDKSPPCSPYPGDQQAAKRPRHEGG